MLRFCLFLRFQSTALVPAAFGLLGRKLITCCTHLYWPERNVTHASPHLCCRRIDVGWVTKDPCGEGLPLCLHSLLWVPWLPGLGPALGLGSAIVVVPGVWPVRPGPGWRDTCCVLGVSQAPLTVGCWVHRDRRGGAGCSVRQSCSPGLPGVQWWVPGFLEPSQQCLLLSEDQNLSSCGNPAGLGQEREWPGNCLGTPVSGRAASLREP